MSLQKRSVASVILLTLFTCGLYNLYWVYVITDELSRSVRDNFDDVASPGMVILLSFLTCGLYMIFWIYRQSSRIHKLGLENGVNIGDNSIVNLLLAIFSLSIISIAIMQSDINKIVDYLNNSNNHNNNNNYYNNNDFNNNNNNF